MTFSNQFIEILNALCDKVGITVDWTSSNVLPYLQDLIARFVKYETYTSILWLIIGLILTISCIRLLRKEFKSSEYTDGTVIFVGLIIAAFGFFMTIGQAVDIIEVNTIPEKTIINYIKYLNE